MQLPEDFPHTRREQYLVALPEQLQTDEELHSGMGVLRRLRRFYDRITLLHVIRLRADGCSAEEILRVLTTEARTELREERWRRGPLARR